MARTTMTMNTGGGITEPLSIGVLARSYPFKEHGEHGKKRFHSAENGEALRGSQTRALILRRYRRAFCFRECR